MSPVPADWPEHWATASSVARNMVREYKNWEWDSEEEEYGAASALFDFRVFPFLDGKQTAESDEDKWSISFTYMVVNISGEGRGFDSTEQPTQQRLIREILMLSYATADPLPKRGGVIFPEEGSEEYEVSAWPSPVVDTISVRQDAPNSDVWYVTYGAKKLKFGSMQKKPDPVENPPELRDPYPWECKPKVTINYGTEEYQTGCAYFLGYVTPAQVGNAAQSDNGLGSALTPSSSDDYQAVVNSVGDPLRSPPSIKAGTTVVNINVAYMTNESLGSVIGHAKSANCTINDDDVTLYVFGDAHYFYKGNAMLTGFSISPAEYTDRREWLPKQKHPFEKTYEDLGWTYSGDETDIAVNPFSKTLVVTRGIEYKQLQLSFTVKATGWGSALASRGYRSFDEGDGDTPEPIGEKNSSRADERLLDSDGKVVEAGLETVDTECIMLYCPFRATSDLKSLLNSLPWNRQFPEPWTPPGEE